MRSFILSKLTVKSLVCFVFCGWGDLELPQSLDDVVDWLRNFEIDHGIIPGWVYTLYSRLLEYKDQCEILTAKHRVFNLSMRMLLDADTCFKLGKHGSCGSPLHLFLRISLPLATP